MEIKSSEKINTAKKQRSSVSVCVEKIPLSVHSKIRDYMDKIRYERKRKYTIKQAYREFLIEKTK